MANRKPDPKETIKLIERLKELRLDNDTFRLLHHLHASMNGFERYARNVTSFEEDGNNRRVHKRLEFVLDSCANGMPPGKTFAALAEEAMRRIPPL